MKRVIAILCLALLFSGCTSAQPDPTTEALETTVVTTEPTTIPTEVPTEAPTEPPTEPTPELQIYPLNPGMAYFDYAAQLPDHIYNTLGSENGLEGTIYAFDGTVTGTDALKTGVFAYDCATVETKGGNVYILNMYKTVCDKGGKAIYSDNEDYYIFPEIGEEATFLTVYMGYSNVKEMPAFILGASADVMDIGEYEDPVAARLEAIVNP